MNDAGDEFDGLIRQAAWRETPPASVVVGVRRRIRAWQQRRLFVGVGTAAALTIAFAVWRVGWERPGAVAEVDPQKQPAPVVEPSPNTQTPTVAASAPGRVELVSASENVIVRPLESKRPGVTIFWLHPTIR